MLKVSKRASTMISFVLSIILLVILIVALFALPSITDFYLTLSNKHIDSRNLILALLYVALIPAIGADISLLSLLHNVRNEFVFSASSVKLLRIISWCCFAEFAVFALLGYFFYMSFLIAFAAIFLGITLRVVKNVIEEATYIKSENDFTI